jgi:hypothetical protein
MNTSNRIAKVFGVHIRPFKSAVLGGYHAEYHGEVSRSFCDSDGSGHPAEDHRVMARYFDMERRASK